MAKSFAYTTLANRYTARFPALTYVGTQVNFWILTNIFLATILHLYACLLSQAYQMPVTGSFTIMLLIAVLLGIFYGLSLGLIGYYLDLKIFKRLALGKALLLKAMLLLVLLMAIVGLIRFAFFELWIVPSFYKTGITLNQKAWNSLFYLLFIYYFFMTLVISFINQVNKKYGPGVLVPLLLGKYSQPQEEERIFMFMDLKSSTTIAESLGHLKYSAFIRDCFSDINEVLYPFYAQVYQYVGDEIVVMWPVSEGLRHQACIRFYFACQEQFQNRATHYTSRYGMLPVFKAGLHMGQVTAVEIGEIKKDIAYHGDTLNTAARIQSICNDYKKDFLASAYLLEKIGHTPNMMVERLGELLLKGKTEKVGIVSVNTIS